MKKRLWKPPVTGDDSSAVDIPRLKEKEKKKKGAPFWFFGGSEAPEAVYGSLEEGASIGAQASQAAASAAARAAIPAAVSGNGLLASVFSFWPASLAGNLAAGAMLLVAAASLAGGAALFAKAASPEFPIPASLLGGIASVLNYRKAPSKSLLYASAAARGLASETPQSSAQADMENAASASASAAAPGQASGAPMGQNGAGQEAQGAAASLANAPWSGDAFDGSAGGAQGGAGFSMPKAANGKVGGAFESSANESETNAAPVVVADGSPFASLGRFGAGSSEALGDLRGKVTENAGMTQAGTGPLETPAQMASNQFDNSLIGAGAPTGVIVGNSGVPTIPETPNPTAGGGGGGGGTSGGSGGNNSCAQDGLVWNGTACVQPNPPGSNPAAPWQSTISATNILLPIAAAMMILAAIFANLPFGFGKPTAYVFSIIAAALGATVLVMGSGLIGGSGQNTSGLELVMAGGITAAGAVAAFMGNMSKGPTLVPSIIEAIAGLAALLTNAFNPPSNGSGGSGGSSGSSGS